MTPLIRSYVRSCSEVGFDPTEMQWFDLSPVYQDMMAVGDTDILHTHRPPFEKSVVLWNGRTRSHDQYEMMMLVAGTDPEEGIVVDITKGPPGKPVTFPSMVYVIDDGQIRYGPVDENHDVEEKVASLMLALVAGFYAALDTGIHTHKPSIAQTFTNRRKIAQGKTPAYDWTTVFIEPSKARSEHKGGTHASPRQHDRRGHLRRLRSGKNVWVKAHKVGDATKGIIWHDYEVRAA